MRSGVTLRDVFVYIYHVKRFVKDEYEKEYLDEEAKEDLIINENYEIYNGALYESLVSEALVKSGFKLYFYKNNVYRNMFLVSY